MTNPLYQRVLDTIDRYGMIRPGDRIGLGVSGGADSVAMLRIFADLRVRLGIALVVLHFHHQLRGSDADEDERFVEALAEQFQFEFQSGRGDVAGEARRRGWNLEDAARRMRYQFLDSAASARRLNRVAVAHTRDDQAETVLSRLLRGTGLTGLAGIYPLAGRIIRPLLDVSRDDLRAFLSGLGQPWREDATNQDTSRMRSRIRRQLIPLLHRDFDPAAAVRLARLAEHAREDEAFWQGLESERLARLARRESPGVISVAIEDLLSPLPLSDPNNGKLAGDVVAQGWTTALTRRLVRRMVAELRGGLNQWTAQHVQAVLDLATKSQSGARIELPGIRVERVFNRLVFALAPSLRSPQKTAEEPHSGARNFAYTVSRLDDSESASVAVSEIHRRFHLKVVDWPSAKRDTGAGRGALDFDRVRWPLVLRNWRPGDSYQPQGSRRARKLKRLLLEFRVPRSARESWPVLTSDEKVIWASGCPVADQFAPQAGTKTGLLIGEEEF